MDRKIGDHDIARLIRAAREGMAMSYSPYSHFRVGAALLCEDGSIYSGCNIENASYPATLCAERTALAKAVSEGKTRLSAMAVISGGEDICTPCGICRQTLAEFGTELAVYCCKNNGEYQSYTLKELLPHAFIKFDGETT